MTATIENIVGLKSAIEHAKSLKPYSNMGISAALVIEVGDTLAAQAKEVEALKAQVEQLRKGFSDLQSCSLNSEYNKTLSKIRVIFNATPVQCLAVHDAEIKAQAVRDVIGPLLDDDLNLLICNADNGDWNSLMYRDCWAKGFAEGVREREAINQERLVAKGGE